jgi:hypothetical protein
MTEAKDQDGGMRTAHRMHGFARMAMPAGHKTFVEGHFAGVLLNDEDCLDILRNGQTSDQGLS